jgi:hypothetical protein
MLTPVAGVLSIYLTISIKNSFITKQNINPMMWTYGTLCIKLKDTEISGDPQMAGRVSLTSGTGQWPMSLTKNKLKTVFDEPRKAFTHSVKARNYNKITRWLPIYLFTCVFICGLFNDAGSNSVGWYYG